MSTEKSGSITVSETWDKEGGPYLVTDDIAISGTDVDVIVEPGVEIIVEGGYTIELTTGNPRFIAKGTVKEPIIIRARGAVRWQVAGGEPGWVGFTLSGTGGRGLLLSHVVLRDAQGGISSNAQLFDLQDSVIRNCTTGIVLSDTPGAGRCEVRRVVIEECERAVAISGDAKTGQLEPYKMTIRRCKVGIYVMNPINDSVIAFGEYRENRVYDNDQYGLQIVSGSSAQDMKYVWWGSDSGPTISTNVDGTGDRIALGAGTCDYDPWTKLKTYAYVDDVRAYTNLEEKDVPDHVIERFIGIRQREVDSWILKGASREKLLFVRDTETDEMLDYEGREGGFLQTRYWPIESIDSMSRRDGDNPTTWEALTEGSTEDFYASAEDKRWGLIRILTSPIYAADAFKLTYEHGWYDAPKEIRELTGKLVAIDTLRAVLTPGSGDPFAQRVADLKEETERLRGEIVEKYHRFVVL